jgi:DNA repair exonuclease SbcCD ATPase subunit
MHLYAHIAACKIDETDADREAKALLEKMKKNPSPPPSAPVMHDDDVRTIDHTPDLAERTARPNQPKSPTRDMAFADGPPPRNVKMRLIEFARYFTITEGALRFRGKNPDWPEFHIESSGRGGKPALIWYGDAIIPDEGDGGDAPELDDDLVADEGLLEDVDDGADVSSTASGDASEVADLRRQLEQLEAKVKDFESVKTSRDAWRAQYEEADARAEQLEARVTALEGEVARGEERLTQRTKRHEDDVRDFGAERDRWKKDALALQEDIDACHDLLDEDEDAATCNEARSPKLSRRITLTLGIFQSMKLVRDGEIEKLTREKTEHLAQLDEARQSANNWKSECERVSAHMLACHKLFAREGEPKDDRLLEEKVRELLTSYDLVSDALTQARDEINAIEARHTERFDTLCAAYREACTRHEEAMATLRHELDEAEARLREHQETETNVHQVKEAHGATEVCASGAEGRGGDLLSSLIEVNPNDMVDWTIHLDARVHAVRQCAPDELDPGQLVKLVNDLAHMLGEEKSYSMCKLATVYAHMMRKRV